MTDFVHLHVHSYNSLMDGLNSTSELLEAARGYGQTAMAITDHGTLASHRPLQAAAKKAGLKPILGLEAYISPTDRFDKRTVKAREDNTQVYNHLILLAKDQQGLKNLQKLSEEAWSSGYYYKPRIDRDLLAEYRDGLIVLSGCMNGLIAKAIDRGDIEQAHKITRWFKETFDENFYMEVQAHNPPELNHAMLDLADQYGIKPAATADCHFANPADRAVEEAMLILSTSPKANKEATYEKGRQIGDIFQRYNYLYPERPISFADIDVYVNGRQELSEAFAEQEITRTDIFESTIEIADQVGDYEFHQNLELLPKPKGNDPDAILARKAWDGLRERGLKGVPEYDARLQEELDILKALNFSPYFLIVANMINWARNQDIMVGPGRGSAVGSLVCYALRITNADPLKHNLLFFRFINPERGDFPDIDSDFEDRRRGDVKNYLKRQFKHVASIATFTRFKDKGVIRDAARVFLVPIGDVNKALKNIDAVPGKDFIDDIFLKSPQGKEFAKKYPEVIELAKKLQGRIRSTGMHAAGVVVSREPLSDYAPIETAKDPNDKNGPRIPVVAYDMDEVADIGLVKLDVLGLKNLSVISDTLKAVKERRGIEIDLDNLELEDANVYRMISQGYTKGVFQCEQPAYTGLLIRMGGVHSFAELAASNALVRPGAMNTIGAEYIARKNGKTDVKYVHADMKPFTEETYGEVLYQEQVMLTITEIAGLSMATADKIRKIIGKKKDVREFDAYKSEFIEGASKKIPKKVAEKLWSDFEAHAGYSFNKSHAVAYSLLSYWTAWLKYYYPLEFMTALLKNEGDKDSRTMYFIEAKRLGLRVKLPHINESELDFTIQDDAIRVGLTSIKYISENIGNKIIQRRPFKNYKHLQEVVEEKGSGLTTRVLSALNAVGGAFFEDNPRRGDERNNLYEYLGIPAFDTKTVPPQVKSQFRTLDEYEDTGCFVIMGMVKAIKRGTGWSRLDIIDETGSAGVFHIENTPIEPGRMYVILVAENSVSRYTTLDQIVPNSKNSFVNFLFDEGYPDLDGDFYKVVSFQSRKTKAGKNMASLVVCDAEKNMEKLLVFPGTFMKAYSKCKEGSVVGIRPGQTKGGAIFLEDVY